MTIQLTTFQVGGDLYGIDVMKVQEVTGKMSTVRVPLAPDFVCGLINLRGQIATALGIAQLFGMPASGDPDSSVVCKVDGNLVSLLVDSIGDVIEVSDSQLEPPPEIMPHGVRKFVSGVYKIDGALLSVIDLEKLSRELTHTAELTEAKSA